MPKLVLNVPKYPANNSNPALTLDISAMVSRNIAFGYIFYKKEFQLAFLGNDISFLCREVQERYDATIINVRLNLVIPKIKHQRYDVDLGNIRRVPFQNESFNPCGVAIV